MDANQNYIIKRPNSRKNRILNKNQQEAQEPVIGFN